MEYKEPGLFIANIVGHVGKSRKNRSQNLLGGSQVEDSEPDLGVVGTVEPEDHFQSPRTFLQRYRSRFRGWVAGPPLDDLGGHLAQPQCFVQCQLRPYPYPDHRMT